MNDLNFKTSEEKQWKEDCWLILDISTSFTGNSSMHAENPFKALKKYFKCMHKTFFESKPPLCTTSDNIVYV